MLSDIEKDRKPREPVGVVIKAAKENSKLNFKLLSRMVDY